MISVVAQITSAQRKHGISKKASKGSGRPREASAILTQPEEHSSERPAQPTCSPKVRRPPFGQPVDILIANMPGVALNILKSIRQTTKLGSGRPGITHRSREALLWSSCTRYGGKGSLTIRKKHNLTMPQTGEGDEGGCKKSGTLRNKGGPSFMFR